MISSELDKQQQQPIRPQLGLQPDKENLQRAIPNLSFHVLVFNTYNYCTLSDNNLRGLRLRLWW